DGTSVYVTNEDSNNVSQYDVVPGGRLQRKSPATVAAGFDPIGIAISPDGRNVYVTNHSSGGPVSQYDVGPGGALTPKSPATVDAGVDPYGVVVSPDGNSVYVADNQAPGSPNGGVSQYDVGPLGALAPKNPPTVLAGGFSHN